MMFLVMGLSLVVSALAVVLPQVRKLHTIRDMTWVLVAICLMLTFGLGMLAEGVEQMGWTR